MTDPITSTSPLTEQHYRAIGGVKKRYVGAGLLVAAAALAVPALAQDTTGVADAGVSALQIILGQGIAGAIAVLAIIVAAYKDRQVTRERERSELVLKNVRDELDQKLFALSIQHASDSAKQTSLNERLLRHLERVEK